MYSTYLVVISSDIYSPSAHFGMLSFIFCSSDILSVCRVFLFFCSLHRRITFWFSHGLEMGARVWDGIKKKRKVFSVDHFANILRESCFWRLTIVGGKSHTHTYFASGAISFRRAITVANVSYLRFIFRDNAPGRHRTMPWQLTR